MKNKDRNDNEKNTDDLRNQKRINIRSPESTETKHSAHILLAEDNPINQKLAKMMLIKAGYQVETADTGKEAVDKFITSTGKFDLVFMDMQMPEMGGIEATQHIRRWEDKSIAQSLTLNRKRVPVIALTANANEGDKERCLEVGMDDYITKPINRDIFFEVIEKWISSSKLSEASPL
ncbi:MAG: response regulator [Desulfobacterales bacterium]